MGKNSRGSVRVNGDIRCYEVRVIGSDGVQVGVVRLAEAMRLADESGLDLVEVGADSKPPVCKIMDFGKFKYEQKKQMNRAKKNQKTIEVKEIKLRPKTDVHDFEVKLKHIRRFLGDGNKAKVTVRFRGREMAHPHIARDMLDRIAEEVKSVAVVEQKSMMEGRAMTMVLAPS